MSERREELLAALEAVYRRGSVWGEPSRADDGSVRVSDSGGVTWIGLAVMPEDLEDPAFADRLRDFASQRMPSDGRGLTLRPTARRARQRLLARRLSLVGLLDLPHAAVEAPDLVARGADLEEVEDQVVDLVAKSGYVSIRVAPERLDNPLDSLDNRGLQFLLGAPIRQLLQISHIGSGRCVYDPLH